MLPAPITNLSRRSGVLLVPSHRNHPEGMLATEPDQSSMAPLGTVLALDTIFCTNCVVATCVLLVPLPAVGAVTVPESVEVPLTDRLVKVPTAVILGCVAVLMVPAMVVPAMVVPDKLPPVILPDTANDVNVPSDVTLGCAAVAKVPVIAPDTDSAVNVPTEVMLGCAAVVTVPAKEVADSAPATVRPVRVPSDVMLGCVGVATVPIRLPPGVPTVVAVTVPANKVLVTVRLAKVPISVMLG